MDTVLSNRLVVLADCIKRKNAEVEAQEGQVFSSQLEVGKLMAEARNAFTANVDFAVWLAQNEIGFSANDRAGYILMGNHPDIAKEAFDERKRSARSIGEYIRERLEAQPVIPGWDNEPPEASNSETPLSAPVEPVTAIAPPVIPVAIPNTPPSNPTPTLTLKTRHAQPPASTPRRKQKIDTLIKNKAKADAIIAMWGSGTNYKSMMVINQLLAKKDNRPMVLKMLETIQANGWTPSQTTMRLSPALLNQDFINMGTTFKPTVAGIQACIDEALALDRKAKGLPDPQAEARAEAFQKMLKGVTAKLDPAFVPEGYYEPANRFDTPEADQDIVVFGTTVRRKGENPEVYQDWWQAALLIEKLVSIKTLPPDQVANVGQLLLLARHWVRGLHTYQLEQVMGAIGNAMTDATADKTSGFSLAVARTRVK